MHKHKCNRSVEVTKPQAGHILRSPEAPKHDVYVWTEQAYADRTLRKNCCETFYVSGHAEASKYNAWV